MSQLLFSWRGNLCCSPSAHYQVCWTFLRSSWCWAIPDKMNSLPCHITNASLGVEWVTEQELAVSWSRNCCTSHIFSLWIKPTSLSLSEDPPGPALGMSIWGMRHFSDAKASQLPVWKGMLLLLVWISKSENYSHHINLLYLVVLVLIYLNDSEGKSISKRCSCTKSQRHESLSGFLNQKI